MKKLRTLTRCIGLVAFLLGFGTASAAPTFSTTVGSAVLGGTATPTVTLGFGASYDLYSLDVALLFDGSKLSFDSASSLTELTALGWDSILFVDPVLVDLPGDYQAAYFELGGPITLSGPMTSDLFFTVLPGLAPGETTPIELTLKFGVGPTSLDVLVIDLDVTRHPSGAAPEPGTVLLLAAALSALLLARRRWAPRRS